MRSSSTISPAAPPYVGVAGRPGLRCARALRLLGLRRTTARRCQHRGQPDDDQGDVPRRPRPRPAVDGQGQRRHRRQGEEGRPQGLRRRGHRRDTRGRQAAGQRPRGDPADQPPRREVRPAQRATRPRHRQAGEQRRHRPGPHRSQPRGRRGPRRALAAAQRRRRRPAQDDLLRAEQRLGGPRAAGALGADPAPLLHGAAGREQGSPSSPPSRTPTAWRWRSAATTVRSRRARRHPGRAAVGGQPARRPGQAAPGR